MNVDKVSAEAIIFCLFTVVFKPCTQMGIRFSTEMKKLEVRIIALQFLFIPKLKRRNLTPTYYFLFLLFCFVLFVFSFKIGGNKI